MLDWHVSGAWLLASVRPASKTRKILWQTWQRKIGHTFLIRYTGPRFTYHVRTKVLLSTFSFCLPFFLTHLELLSQPSSTAQKTPSLYSILIFYLKLFLKFYTSLLCWILTCPDIYCCLLLLLLPDCLCFPSLYKHIPSCGLGLAALESAGCQNLRSHLFARINLSFFQ